MERDVTVCEVGLRDGLQSIQSFYPTEATRAWIAAEAAAGVPELQACSFVPVSTFEQFKDADEVVAHATTLSGLTVSAFTPNAKGAERAIAAGVHKLGHVTSASESHNQNNLRRSVGDTIAEAERIIALRSAASPDTKVSGCVATAFGCTIEGTVSVDAVLRLATRYLELGVDELVLADTVGYANPRRARCSPSTRTASSSGSSR